MGALDDGKGRFVKGITFDLDHPDRRGPAALAYAIVPSLFAAIEKGKPRPQRSSAAGHLTVPGGRGSIPLSWIPDCVIHSFAFTFSIRTSSPGAVATVLCGDSRPRVEIRHDGRPAYHSSRGEAVVADRAILDGKWHDLAVSHRHLQGRSLFFVDGMLVGETAESLVPREFVLGSPKKADFRDWLIYRSALNEDEVRALHQGDLLQASLEVFAPLGGAVLEPDTPIENRAQSLASVMACPTGREEAIARLEVAIARSAELEVFVDPAEKKAVAVDGKILDTYTGKYRLDPQLVITISRHDDVLKMDLGPIGTTLLSPLSDTRFVAKAVGVNIEVTFVRDTEGQANLMIFSVDGDERKARRISS
jgi:hypothetical protein